MTDAIVDVFVLQNKDNFLIQIPADEKEAIISYCLDAISKECPSYETLPLILECIKIFARDLSSETYLCKPKFWNKLFELSEIMMYSDNSSPQNSIINVPSNVVENALKALCNLTKNFYTTMPTNLHSVAVKGIINKFKLHPTPSPNYTVNIKIFETKFLFLITALFRDTRFSAIQDSDCLCCFSNVFKFQMENIKSISIEEITLDCEILKCLFNVLYQQMDSDFEKRVENEMQVLLDHLKNLVVEVNLLENIPENVKIELLSNTVNLLTSVPDNCFQFLLFDSKLETDIYKDSQALKFYHLVLKLIDRRLNENTNLLETLCPVMHAIGKACLLDRNIRKYYRLKVLPYMRNEVMELPERGTSIRNKLCKLLQHPTEQVTESVAFFLFILCKEDVERAIKYTGFGNFAGFLARHALLAGRANSDVIYSDSEDSETEEYLNVKDKINPVTGRVEENQINPLDDMTEEQKEYEVVRLMNQIDLLQRQGIIKPGIISEDGSVRAADSVLEVMERSAQQSRYKSDHENDSIDND